MAKAVKGGRGSAFARGRFALNDITGLVFPGLPYTAFVSVSNSPRWPLALRTDKVELAMSIDGENVLMSVKDRSFSARDGRSMVLKEIRGQFADKQEVTLTLTKDTRRSVVLDPCKSKSLFGRDAIGSNPVPQSLGRRIVFG